MFAWPFYLTPQLAALDPAHDRHVYVKEDDVERPLFELPKRLLPIGDHRNFVSGIG